MPPISKSTRSKTRKKAMTATTEAKEKELREFLEALNRACLKIQDAAKRHTKLEEVHNTVSLGLEVFTAFDDVDDQLEIKRGLEQGWQRLIKSATGKYQMMDAEALEVAKAIFILGECAVGWSVVEARHAIKDAQTKSKP